MLFYKSIFNCCEAAWPKANVVRRKHSSPARYAEHATGPQILAASCSNAAAARWRER